MEEAALSPAPTHTEARPQHFGAQPHHPHGSRARPGGPGPACGEPGGGRPGLPRSGSGPVPLPCPLARMATAPRGRPLTSVPAGGGVAGGEEQDGAQRQRLGAPHAEVVVDLPLAQGVGQGRHLGSSMTTERGRAGGPSGAALGPRGRPRQPPPPAATVPTGAAETSPTPAAGAELPPSSSSSSFFLSSSWCRRSAPLPGSLLPAPRPAVLGLPQPAAGLRAVPRCAATRHL